MSKRATIFSFIIFIVPCIAFIPRVYAQKYLIEEDGYVIVEAEDVDPGKGGWRKTTNPVGFTGECFLNYGGSSHSGHGNYDCSGNYFAPVDERLTFNIIVSNPGNYCVNARVYHRNKDGDNDAHFHMKDFPINSEFCLKRIGEKEAPGSFAWLSFGHRQFYLDRGLNTLYIGGRSKGFGIDRVVFFLHKYQEKTSHAENHNSATTEIVEAQQQPGPSQLGAVVMHATDFPYEAAGYEPWSSVDSKTIKLKSGYSGSVTAPFPGESGKYDIQLAYIAPGGDVGGTFEVSIPGQSTGPKPVKNTGKTEFGTVYWSNVQINEGDQVTVKNSATTGDPAGAFRAVTFYSKDGKTTYNSTSVESRSTESSIANNMYSVRDAIHGDRIILHDLAGRILKIVTLANGSNSIDLPRTGLSVVRYMRDGTVLSSKRVLFK
jgi:hypothetical protein